MIIKYNELTGLRRKVVMVDGCFDPLHHGHITYFQFAVRFGLPVLCNIENDEYLRKIKKRPPLLPLDVRVVVIDAIKFITYTHPQSTTTYDVLGKLRPLKYVKGADWKNKILPKEEITLCKRYGIEVEFMDNNLDSSTQIIARYLAKMKKFV